MTYALTCSLIAAWLTSRPAAAQHLALAPPATSIAYTVYALGLWPIHATFGQFDGSVTLATEVPPFCAVDVTIQVSSLRMADPDRQRQALGADMLDAAHYPTMHFAGKCTTSTIDGRLTMHGVTHAISFGLRKAHGQLICTGLVRRSDYGVTGLAGIVGPNVRLRFTTPAPAGFK